MRNSIPDELTIAEAAAARGVSPQAVLYWIRPLGLPALRVGPPYVIRRVDLDGFTPLRPARKAAGSGCVTRSGSPELFSCGGMNMNDAERVVEEQRGHPLRLKKSKTGYYMKEIRSCKGIVLVHATAADVRVALGREPRPGEVLELS